MSLLKSVLSKFSLVRSHFKEDNVLTPLRVNIRGFHNCCINLPNGKLYFKSVGYKYWTTYHLGSISSVPNLYLIYIINIGKCLLNEARAKETCLRNYTDSFLLVRGYPWLQIPIICP